jgi:anti-sigma B factor antagonist
VPDAVNARPPREAPPPAAAVLADPASRAFRIDVRPDRRRVVVAPCGELDLATVAELEGRLQELIADGWAALVLDLRGLSFMDATGLSLVIRLTSRRDVSVEVVDGSDPIARLFDVAGVREHLPFTTATWAAS